MANAAVRQFMAAAAVASDRAPAFKFARVGDGFTNATILSTTIKDIPARDAGKDPVRTLILDLELSAPRTQLTKVVNEQTKYLEEKEITGSVFVHFIKAQSQPLDAFSKAIVEGGGTADSPEPGDVISCQFVGEKATDKGNPQRIYTYSFSPAAGGELPAKAEPASAEFAAGNAFLAKLEKGDKKAGKKTQTEQLDPNDDDGEF